MRQIEVTQTTFDAARKLKGLFRLACGLHDLALREGKDPQEDKGALMAKAAYFDYRRELGDGLLQAVEEFNIKYDRAVHSVVKKRGSEFNLEAIEHFIWKQERSGTDADLAEVVRHFVPDGQQSNEGRRLIRFLQSGFPDLTIIKD